LRTYILKGGFVIFDDLTFYSRSPALYQRAAEAFEAVMQRVLPQARIVPILPTDPVFDGFFTIDPEQVLDLGERGPADIRGAYENNDPTKRLLFVANYKTSLGHKMRFVDTDLGSGIERGGMAYKLGLNYLIYGLSH
jgi:hypothetical protein